MPDRYVPSDTPPSAGRPPTPEEAPGVMAAARPGSLSEGGRDRIPPPDPAELERVRARDPEALAAFFERYFDRLYGLICRLVGDRALAEDMTQETFLKVHRAVHQLDPTRDPAPWLMTIAHNACRDLWRSSAWKLGRRATSLDGDSPLAATLSHGTNDPERDLLADERSRRVQEALLRLPDPLRTAILLHDYDGLGHEEIARITGIGHAAARKRYSRALAALARLLGESLR